MITFDLETTGVDVNNDRIVEICVIKTGNNPKTYRFNPTIPIPKQASDIHGITDELVANEPTFKQRAQSLYNYIKTEDILGFNSNMFDVPILYNEFARSGIIWDYSENRFFDAGNLFKIYEPRTLEAAYMFYCGKELVGAHGAEPDAKATLEVFEEQLKRYDLSKDNLDFICNYERKRVDLFNVFEEREDGIYLAIGKNKGKLAINDKNYLDWIINKSDFSQDVKIIAKQLLYGTTKTK